MLSEGRSKLRQAPSAARRESLPARMAKRYDCPPPVPTEMEDLPLSGLKLIRPAVFEDARGYFLELHHERRFASMGVQDALVQDNL